MKDIAVFGAGGLGKEIPCIIEKINEQILTWNFIGFFDDGIVKGQLVNGYPVIGGINDLNEWHSPLSICIGIGSPKIVKNIVESITNQYIEFPNIIAPDVYFYDKHLVKMGKGNFFNHNVTVSVGVEIGDFNSFGAEIKLGHDSKIGDFNTLMVSSQICGHSKLNTLNFLAIASIVLQGVTVDCNVTIGAGSIVMKDTVNDATYFGNPARPMIVKK